jgi:fimbrial chaperone protein
MAAMRAVRGLIGLLAAALLPLAASASGLSVTPTQLEFRAGDSVQAIWLSNTGDAPLRAQLRVFAWQQPDGSDQLTPSRDLMVSPPMFTIAPGTQQLVRVVRMGGTAAGAGERSYRLLIDEVPDPAAPKKTTLDFVLRYSVPVFAGGDGSAPVLAWQLERGGTQPQLRTGNSGRSRAQVADLVLLDASGATVFEHSGLVGYVLPGVNTLWPFTLPPAAAQATTIQARVNGQTVRQALAAAGPGAR